jgi:hypothetical protein
LAGQHLRFAVAEAAVQVFAIEQTLPSIYEKQLVNSDHDLN